MPLPIRSPAAEAPPVTADPAAATLAAGPPRFTHDLAAVLPLIRLCRQGRLYEVEAWIAQGKPLQPDPAVRMHSRIHPPLEVALRTGQHSLALLLLRHRYQPDCTRRSPFDLALQARRPDLVDLLFAFGADPARVDLELLLESCDHDLFARFLAAGVDLTRGHAIARTLAYHTRNKPLFGFVKRHLADHPEYQYELDLALDYHAKRGTLKGLMLSLWAGADAYARVSDLEYGREEDPEDERGTPVQAAAFRGDLAILKRLRPDPARIDFDRLYEQAGSAAVVEYLARRQPPRCLTRIILGLSSLAGLPDLVPCDWSGALLAVLQCGVCWTQASETDLGQIRRSLLHAPDWTLASILRILAQLEICTPAILHALIRTPAMQRRLPAAGLLRLVHRSPGRGQHGKRASENGTTRCDRASTVRRPPVQAQIERQKAAWLATQYDRARLYEQVWQQPVLHVAREYHVSAVYLARVCRLLRVPVPPRGYWARLRSGQHPKRPPLPALHRCDTVRSHRPTSADTTPA